MKKLENFKQLLKSLKEFGFDIPMFQRTDDFDCYSTKVIDKKLPNLCLDVGLFLGFDYKPKPVSCEDFITNGLTIELSGLEVLLKRLGTFDYISINNEYWHAVPTTLKEEVGIVNKLESFFSRFPEDVVRAQNLAHDLGAYNPNVTWGKLYGDMVKKGNFRWADLNGEEFPYVITNLGSLGNNVGISIGGLYFVAKEAAPELWQEQIVAYHERFYLNEGRLSAREKEAELAKILGKEKEHAAWRKYINETYGKVTN